MLDKTEYILYAFLNNYCCYDFCDVFVPVNAYQYVDPSLLCCAGLGVELTSVELLSTSPYISLEFDKT